MPYRQPKAVGPTSGHSQAKHQAGHTPQAGEPRVKAKDRVKEDNSKGQSGVKKK